MSDMKFQEIQQIENALKSGIVVRVKYKHTGTPRSGISAGLHVSWDGGLKRSDISLPYTVGFSSSKGHSEEPIRKN